jgi:hypothetical protein
MLESPADDVESWDMSEREGVWAVEQRMVMVDGSEI